MMAGLFDIGGNFKPRFVAGVEATRFIEPHDCEEIDSWRVVIEHTPSLYDWCHDVHAGIIERHKTINKPVRRTELWGAVLGTEKDNSWPGTAADQVAVESDSQSTTPALNNQSLSDAQPRKAGTRSASAQNQVQMCRFDAAIKAGI